MSDLLKQVMRHVNSAVQSLAHGEMDEGTFAIVLASVAQAKAMAAIAEQLEKLVNIYEDQK